LGGATGIVMTTFVLAPKWGMHASFAALMAGSAALAAIAWGLSTRSAATAADARGFAARTAAPAGAGRLSAAAFSKGEPASNRARAGGAAVPGMSSIWLALAAFSGFNVLGLEILALHLFGQVLNNSLYTFAVVLAVVIAALGASACVVQRWRMTRDGAIHRAALLLFATGTATAVVSRLFLALTHGMQPYGGGAPSMGGYVVRILGLSVLVLGPAFMLAGTIFPLTLAGVGSETTDEPTGGRWGRLLGFNAAG